MTVRFVVSIFGPPAAGKTTLTVRLGVQPGRRVFRLREHVPHAALVATASDSDRLGWIEESTVDNALRNYFESVNNQREIQTVLLDNFPGTGQQVGQLVGVLKALTPPCHGLEAIEVVTDAKTLQQRAKNRKVCHRCENDPIADPRLPAISSSRDPWQCGRCGGLLHPRRGDAPRLFKARMRRYHQSAAGIRAGFADRGILVTQLDTTSSIESSAGLLNPLLISRSAS